MIKENLLVLPALSFGACLVRAGKDRDLARWDLGAETLPWELLVVGLGSPQLEDESRALYLLNIYFWPCDSNKRGSINAEK